MDYYSDYFDDEPLSPQSQFIGSLYQPGLIKPGEDKPSKLKSDKEDSDDFGYLDDFEYLNDD
jgi:hypothetical protein